MTIRYTLTLTVLATVAAALIAPDQSMGTGQGTG
jgi:hypothetical protein